jgi:hypothetical protein
MGKNPNTFQKRQREMEKKRKAEDKRKRRQAAKNAAENRNGPPAAGPDDDSRLADWPLRFSRCHAKLSNEAAHEHGWIARSDLGWSVPSESYKIHWW